MPAHKTRFLAQPRICLVLGVATLSLVPGLAWAEQQAPAADTGLSEIVVTAQKREERLQNVPLAISAVSGQNLKAVGITKAEDLKYTVSGLNFERAQFAFHPRIRGVGTVDTGPGVENSVAVYVDGVYYTAGAASNVEFNDVERVEVLKGPQGTLFGRNATGGAVNVITKKPSLTESTGSADISYGNYQTLAGNFYASTPLSEKVAMSLALQGSRQGKGYGINLYNNTSVNRNKMTFSGRFKLLLQPSDRTEVLLAADYSRRKGNYAYAQNPNVPITPGNLAALIAAGKTAAAVPSGDIQVINQDLESILDVEDFGASLTIQHDADIFQIKSITAARKNVANSSSDNDLSPISTYELLGGPVTTRQVTQELQLLSPTESRLKWILGGYMFWSDYGSNPFDITWLSGLRTGGTNFLDRTPQFRVANEGTTKSWAVFGQATYDIAPQTNLTLGVRYTSETRHRGGSLIVSPLSATPFVIPLAGDFVNGDPVTGDVTFKRATWRVALDHHFSDAIMVYASVNRGFKSGGFQMTGNTPAFKPEILDAYELGVKSELLDRRLRLNVAGFYYNYKDVQVTSSIGAIQSTTNGAKARVYGVDMDIEGQVTRALTLTTSFEYAPNKFTDYRNAPCFHVDASQFTCDATGTPLPESPEFSISAAANYDVTLGQSGDLRFTLLGYHQSSGRKTQHAEGLNGTFIGEDGYTTVNGSIQWTSPDKTYFVKAFANNITNKQYALQTEVIGAGGAAVGSHYKWAAAPRTYGVQVGLSW